VITTGDNYVGAAENELREDMAGLYATICGYDGAPSSTQMENFEKVEAEMEASRIAYKKLESTVVSKYLATVKKMELKEPKMKSYEEFVKKD